MNKIGLIISCTLTSFILCAQRSVKNPELVKISREELAGENLSPRKVQGEEDISFYQQRIFDGQELSIYIVAIKNRINEFKRFPVEEFIFWADGKAIVEPLGKESFEIQTGDYFIQPKGFNGKFNFVSGDQPHLELAAVSKRRADSTLVSPITQAMIINRDILSGSSMDHAGENAQIYSGIELDVNLVRFEQRLFNENKKDRLIHILSGVLTIKNEEHNRSFYPGDFFVIPKGFSGEWKSIGFQSLRAIEVYQVDF